MSSPWIAGLRSVALVVPDVERTARFYTEVWRLDEVARTPDGSVYLRASGEHHHVLSLHPGARAALRDVTLHARSADALQEISRAAVSAGGTVLVPPGPIGEPGGGTGLTLRDADGRVLRVLHGDARHADAHEAQDKPVRLAHAVLNAHDVPAAQRFFERALGFRLSDRTRIMAFMNCGRDHHSVALADADNDALNHIAFLMPDLESVMRGGGRMRDAGYAIEWGPGRHGPGNNAFNYFVGPDEVVIEYTSDVEQIDERYRVRGPHEWTWPAGRVDQWGISPPPSARLKQAQRAIRFVNPGDLPQ